MIINTGRGGLIDTEALIDGLRSAQIGAAGLDVYEEEKDYFYQDHSSEVITDDKLALLLSYTNVLVTSHQAFFTRRRWRTSRRPLCRTAGTSLTAGSSSTRLSNHTGAGRMP